MADETEAIFELSAALAAELAASAVAKRGGSATSCNNCGTPLIGPYCAACGQPHETYRKSIGRLLWETLEHFVNFDSRLMQTMGALMLVPGELPRAFKAGQTQRYVPAPRLYLFVSLFFFLILSISGIALMQFEVNISPSAAVTIPEAGLGFEIGPKQQTEEYKVLEHKAEIGQITPEEVKQLKKYATGSSVRPWFFTRIGAVQSHIPDEIGAQLSKALAQVEARPPGLQRWVGKHFLQGITDLSKDPAAVNGPLTAWIPRVLFLLLPLFAALLWLFYWRQRKKFLLIDHLVFSLTLHTFAFMILILAALTVQAAPADAVGLAALLIIVAYFFFSMKWFYGQGWFWTTTKFLVVGFIYMFFFLIPALGLVIVASMVQA